MISILGGGDPRSCFGTYLCDMFWCNFLTRGLQDLYSLRIPPSLNQHCSLQCHWFYLPQSFFPPKKHNGQWNSDKLGLTFSQREIEKMESFIIKWNWQDSCHFPPQGQATGNRCCSPSALKIRNQSLWLSNHAEMQLPSSHTISRLAVWLHFEFLEASNLMSPKYIGTTAQNFGNCILTVSEGIELR